MSYSVKAEDFDTLGEEWQRLLPQCTVNSVFLTPQWQRTWWHEWGQDRELFLLSVRHKGQLVGIAPLMRRGDTLSFIGDIALCDYQDFVVVRGQEREVYEALNDFLQTLDWRTMDLCSLPAHSPTLSYLPRMAQEKGYSVETAVVDVCPRVELPSTWEGYLASLGRKDRHELRRKIRRLSETGDFTCYMVEDSERLSQDIEDFFRLLRQGRGDKAQFMTPDREGFFRAIASALAQEGYLRLFFLETNGTRVATAMAFDYQDELSLYNSGYDPAYAFLSVGLLLKAFCLQGAIARGKRWFDFLRGSESYKYDLGGRNLPVHSILIIRHWP